MVQEAAAHMGLEPGAGAPGQETQFGVTSMWTEEAVKA